MKKYNNLLISGRWSTKKKQVRTNIGLGDNFRENNGRSKEFNRKIKQEKQVIQFVHRSRTILHQVPPRLDYFQSQGMKMSQTLYGKDYYWCIENCSRKGKWFGTNHKILVNAPTYFQEREEVPILQVMN